MRLIVIYICLFALSVLALQPVWASAKYIVPILPFIILFIGIFVARGMIVAKKLASRGKSKNLGQKTPINLPFNPVGVERYRSIIILLAFLLGNAVWLGTQIIGQISDNIDYIKGDRYAGYPPEVREMFEAFERARDLPDSVVLVCRKPEILYIVSGRQSIYPWQAKENK